MSSIGIYHLLLHLSEQGLTLYKSLSIYSEDFPQQHCSGNPRAYFFAICDLSYFQFIFHDGFCSPQETWSTLIFSHPYFLLAFMASAVAAFNSFNSSAEASSQTAGCLPVHLNSQCSTCDYIHQQYIWIIQYLSLTKVLNSSTD